MLIDVYEPVEIELGLKEFLTTVERDTLNDKGLGDYCWYTDKLYTVERKSADDLIGSIIKGSLRVRIQQCLENADRVLLLVERPITPWYGGTATWKQAKNKKVFYPVMKHPKVPYAVVEAFLFSLMEVGVSVAYTATIRSSVLWLHTVYENSHKPEHTILSPYAKAQIKPILEKPDPYVEQLMSIPYIGEVGAKKLINKYGTPLGVYRKSETVLSKVVGIKAARSIKQRVGS